MAVWSVMPNLYSADVDRAVAFYRDLLGGTQTFRHPAEGKAEHVELRLGDIMIAISSMQAVESEGTPAPTGGPPMRLPGGCAPADDTVAALRAAGPPVLQQPYSHYSGHRRAYVADPDGNWIVLASKEG